MNWNDAIQQMYPTPILPPPAPPIFAPPPPPPARGVPALPLPLPAPLPRGAVMPRPMPAPAPRPAPLPVDPVEAALEAQEQFHKAVSAVPIDMRDKLVAPAPFKWSGKSSRDKGQRGEREVIDILQPIVDVVRKRFHLPAVVLQRNLMQAHLGGCDIHGLDGFAFEIKRHEQEDLNGWWKQAVAQGEKLKAVPILMWRGNGSKLTWKAMIRGAVVIPTRDKSHLSLDADFVLNLQAFLVWFEGAYAETLKLIE